MTATNIPSIAVSRLICAATTEIISSRRRTPDCSTSLSMAAPKPCTYALSDGASGDVFGIPRRSLSVSHVQYGWWMHRVTVAPHVPELYQICRQHIVANECQRVEHNEYQWCERKGDSNWHRDPDLGNGNSVS